MLALTLAALLVCQPEPAPKDLGPTPPGAARKASSRAGLEAKVDHRIAEVLAAATETGDLGAAATSLRELLDNLAVFAPEKEADSFRGAAGALRMIEQVSALPADRQREMLAFLRENKTLAARMAFMIKPQDKVAGAYALLDRLRAKHGEDLDELASLAAAVCVVHDQPLKININENKVEAPDPVAIFDYFARADKRLNLSVRSAPAELLVNVVDLTIPIEDAEWALAKYGGDSKVGERYFDIDYDTDHFIKRTPKKVTVAGFSLRNILKHGGVCADQAYFAASVAKSIGVPSAYLTGTSAEVGHAWVGYLAVKGKSADWNFDSGHYKEYQDTRGELLDPQTRERVPDATLALVAESLAAKPAVRQQSAAMVDAVLRLQAMEKNGRRLPEPMESLFGADAKPVRDCDVQGQLALLEAALKRCPAYAEGWYTLRDMAADGRLSFDDKKRWATTLDRLCGKEFPDFSLTILLPMIASVSDATQRDAAYDAAFKSFAQRPDLAAMVRFEQGEMWEKQGDAARAWESYHDVVTRFVKAGPCLVEAMGRCEELLETSGKAAEIVKLYAATWPKLEEPRSAAPEVRGQSNWARVGMRYAMLLEKQGDQKEAEKIRGRLGIMKK